MRRKPVLLCLGDSNTNGFFAGTWVPSLAEAVPNLHPINTGVNGAQAAYVHAALPRNLAAAARAGGPLLAATLLVGTNDAMLSLSQDAGDPWGQAFYRVINGDTGRADVDSFKQQLRCILSDLETHQLQHAQKVQPQRASFGSEDAAAAEEQSPASPAPPPPAQALELFVFTIPPLGEDLEHGHNQRADAFNAAIREFVLQFQEGRGRQGVSENAGGAALRVTLLDLNAACKEAIQRGGGADGGADADGGGDDVLLARNISDGSASSDASAADDASAVGSSASGGSSIRPAISGLSGAGGDAGESRSAGSPGLSAAAPPPPRRRSVPRSFLQVGFGMAACAFRRHVLRVPYDAQSEAAGTCVLTPDCVHLNEAGGRLLRGLLEPQLRRLLTAAATEAEETEAAAAAECE